MLQNIGLSEFVLIAIAALVLFGPDKMPEMGRKLGKAVRELRSVTAAFLADATRDPEQRRSAASETAASPAPSAPDTSEAGASGAAASTVAPADLSASAALAADPSAETPAPAPPIKPHRSADPRRLPE